MNKGRYLLPAPVGNALSRLPLYPGSALFAFWINLAIAKHLPQDVLSLMEGKKFRINVTDAQLVFDFQWTIRNFAPCRNNEGADLTIAASAHDFLLLAQRKEDPDTLFFGRRLEMDGDTELGVLVKNSLDAIDVPLLDLESLKPQRVLECFERLVLRHNP